MIPCAIRKLYVDVVDETGTVWIFYFVEMRGFFGRTQLAGVERYPRTGVPSFQRATVPPPWPAGPKQNDRLAFRMDLPDGPVEFSGQSLCPPWIPGGDPLPLPIAWRVVAPSLVVTLRPAGATAPVSGMGYADHVDLRSLPRSAGVRHLRWGRAHGPGGALAFTSVVPRQGTPWCRAALWHVGGGFTEWLDFDLEERLDGITVRPPGAGAGTFFLGNERTLRRGGAVDAGRFPRAGERLLYRLLMGRTAESRWTGSAQLNGQPGTCVHESVEFGPPG